MRQFGGFGLPLYLGIGAVRLDRNSVADRNIAQRELRDTAFQRASLIKSVQATIRLDVKRELGRSWPGDLYIENTNGQTDLELFAVVLEGCATLNRHRGKSDFPIWHETRKLTHQHNLRRTNFPASPVYVTVAQFRFFQGGKHEL